MNAKVIQKKLKDNGGRRSGIDRRQFSYTLHIPERRNGIERRNGRDRRQKPRYEISVINDKKKIQESS